MEYIFEVQGDLLEVVEYMEYYRLMGYISEYDHSYWNNGWVAFMTKNISEDEYEDIVDLLVVDGWKVKEVWLNQGLYK